MKAAIVKLMTKITYLNVVLTIVAFLLAIQVTHNLGLFVTTSAHAGNVMPVQIEGVRGTIPVAIKEPLSSYPSSVCVSPCK